MRKLVILCSAAVIMVACNQPVFEEGDTTTLHLYTAVPSDKVLPTGIPYTILEELYIIICMNLKLIG